MRTLRSPLSEEDVRSLKLGDTVYLFGPVVTGRDEVHIRALERAEKGEPVPDDLKESVLYHCGPIMSRSEDGSWRVVAAGPTTSARMNRLEPEMIRRFRVRAIIGKGGMSDEVAEAMREVGCVYLAATGGAAVSLADGLGACRGAEWLDLGMPEAMWRFEADRLGPLIVAIDSRGESLYRKVSESLVRDRRPRSYRPRDRAPADPGR